jgi:hypothetical protein
LNPRAYLHFVLHKLVMERWPNKRLHELLPEPMGEGSPARVWTSVQHGPDGPYHVVMIDDGAGGVTMTPDLKGWTAAGPNP